MSATSPLTIQWMSLYIPQDDARQVDRALRAVYAAAGYKPYNPFPGGGGTPHGLKNYIRLFVAPAHAGWTRIIGQPDETILPALAEHLGCTVVSAWVGESDSGIETIGQNSLADFLLPGKTLEDLDNPEIDTTPAAEAKRVTEVPEISQFAQEKGVNVDTANKLIEKTTRSLFRKMSKPDDDVQSQAMMALAGKNQFSWDSPAAKHLAAQMACLTIPDNWRNPSFKDLSAAYQVAALLDQNEDAPLLPGDEEILDRVEYPLDYQLAYFAK